MNHQRIYENIIAKAKSENRQKGYLYYENHHIKPRCLGGGDEKENLVLLTAKEHFICHKLLVKIYPEERKIAQAFFMMTISKNLKINISWRDYQYGKEMVSKAKLGVVSPLVGKKRPNISGHKNGMYQKDHSDEAKEKISKSNLGRKWSNEINKKKGLKGEKNPNFGKSLSEETKRKIGLKSKEHQKGEKNSMYGKKHSVETKHLIRLKRLEEHNIKLSNKDIIFIKSNHKKITNVKLSEMFNVPYTTIRNIHKGRYDWLCN